MGMDFFFFKERLNSRCIQHSLECKAQSQREETGKARPEVVFQEARYIDLCGPEARTFGVIAPAFLLLLS